MESQMNKSKYLSPFQSPFFCDTPSVVALRLTRLRIIQKDYS